MKTNRQARRLFGAFGKISNTRRIEFRKRSDHWSGWEIIYLDQGKPTRRQKQRKHRVAAIVAWSKGQHTHRGREIEQNKQFGGKSS